MTHAKPTAPAPSEAPRVSASGSAPCGRLAPHVAACHGDAEGACVGWGKDTQSRSNGSRSRDSATSHVAAYTVTDPKNVRPELAGYVESRAIT
jgi:hypothetical protein